MIFTRDIFLILPLLAIFFQQIFNQKLHSAYLLFGGVILLHGTVMMLNIGSYMAVIYGTKMLMTLLAGALAAQILFRPGRAMLVLVFCMWTISWAGVLLDKFDLISLPWAGLETEIGDIQVEISRDWEISGAEKRAGGFMRSSINVATILPLLALMLMFNLRSAVLRVSVALLTLPALIWTTQKGPIVAYLLMLGFLMLMPRRPIPALRIGVLLTITLCIAFPVILPHYTMPTAEGVFSFSSFYQRVEEMWPDAWRWIARHEAFPFGVGLGGISGAQRMYALSEMNAADNLFILMYAYFGVMSLLYLGAVAVIAIRTRGDASPMAAHAMATLVFLFGYGCVISILEDQMASLFLGGAIGWLCHEIAETRRRQLSGGTAVTVIS